MEMCLHRGTSYSRRLYILDPTTSHDAQRLRRVLEEVIESEEEESQAAVTESTETFKGNGVKGARRSRGESPPNNRTNETSCADDSILQVLDISSAWSASDPRSQSKQINENVEWHNERTPKNDSNKKQKKVTPDSDRVLRPRGKKRSSDEMDKPNKKNRKVSDLNEDRCLLVTTTGMYNSFQILKCSI